MPPPYLAESPYRVIIEFQKSNAGVGRVIKLAYTSLEVPAQLHGGIPIEVWDPFMEDVEQLAKEHPYTASQSADQCCFNVGGLTCFLCIGVGCMEPDGGDYNVWERKKPLVFLPSPTCPCLDHGKASCKLRCVVTTIQNQGGGLCAEACRGFCARGLQCKHASFWWDILDSGEFWSTYTRKLGCRRHQNIHITHNVCKQQLCLWMLASLVLWPLSLASLLLRWHFQLFCL